MSPCLFTLLLTDLDDVLEEGCEGIKVGGRKIYSLAYADNVAVVAKDKNGLKGMIKRFEKYVDGKGLKVNVEKPKVMKCKKGRGRWKKVA